MLRLSTFSALFLLTVLAGCGPRTAPLRVDAQHPASPDAPEGRTAPGWNGLRADEFDQAIAAATGVPAGAEADRDSAIPVHEEHAVPAHRGHDQGSRDPAPKAAVPPPQASASARDQAQPAFTYACPMHPEVTDTKASECLKCGMTLVRRKENRP